MFVKNIFSFLCFFFALVFNFQDPTGCGSCFRYSRTTKNAADLARQQRSYNM